MVYLLTELNAVEKLSLTKTWLSDWLDRRRRVACTAASAPPKTSTLTWIGCNSPLLRFITNFLAHLAANRLRVLTTATGLMPPSFFCSAISFPPNRIPWPLPEVRSWEAGWRSPSVWSSGYQLTHCLTRRSSVACQTVTTTRWTCWECPQTFDDVIGTDLQRFESSASGGRIRQLAIVWWRGVFRFQCFQCFSVCRWWNVVRTKQADCSSEIASLQLARNVEARRASCPRAFLLLCFSVRSATVGKLSLSSVSRFRTTLARLLSAPPLDGFCDNSWSKCEQVGPAGAFRGIC